MLRPSTNIIPKYRYETHYNYMGNSGFFASNCIDIWDSDDWNEKYGSVDKNLGAMMKKISLKGKSE